MYSTIEVQDTTQHPTAKMMNFFQSMPRPTKTYHSATYDRISKHNGFDGKGKTILITGGAGGVGNSMAKAFAEAGVARIAIVGRTQETLAEAKTSLEAAYPPVEFLTFQTSISDENRMNEVLQELGAVDVLILNAAAVHRRAPGTEISTEEIRDAFETNVIAAFNLTKAYLKMSTPPSGRKTVINVSSAVAQMFGNRIGYGSSKGAGAQVMQHFAAENQGEDVRIFSFHPGAFYTPGVAKFFPGGGGQWEDINLPAHFALWLAGPESSFLHGRYLWAHWDVDELIGLKDKVTQDANFLKIGLVM